MTTLDPVRDTIPALVVEASPHVINSHSDFFRREFARWLSERVLQFQERRLRRVIDVREKRVAE